MDRSKPETASHPRFRTSSGLTRLGLAMVVLGWAGLLAGPALAGLLHRVLPGAEKAALPGFDPVVVSEYLILSGFGLAILGALQTGFRALSTFFEAILLRAAAPKREPPAPSPVKPASPVVVPAPPKVDPAKVDPDKILERGRIKGRPYAAFADGSIEVETLLGPRRFLSLDEAREFIGS